MKLFEPGKIGKLVIKNRIVMAAMATMLTDTDGRLSQREIDYYTARAKGGTGLIVTSAARTRQIEQLPFTPLVDQLVIDAKSSGARLGELAENIHDYGAKVAVQFMPGAGRHVRLEILKYAGAVAASPLPAFWDPSVTARELTTEEAERLTHAFQFSAEVVRGAGIDAIEINAHGGYIVDGFLTGLWNKRTDKYGGDLEGRLTFLLEIIESIRKGAGVDFPIIVKYPLTHYLEGGRQVEEGLEIARRLEAIGIDALDIDAGCYDETYYWFLPTTYQPPGCTVDLAEKVKRVVNIPIITVGRLQYPDFAERVLQDGKADFIALARGLLADPEWANKVKEGRLEDVRPCLGDHEGCIGRFYAGMSISCTVNPACGNERELALSTAEKKKSVLVVGGGPGGMEVAKIAALRGHKVTLCEKNHALGGNLIPGSVPDFKHDYRQLINHLATQLEKLGVEIKLATEVTPELVQEMKPEVVVIATGSKPVIPEIPGVDKGKVITAVDALLGRKKVGEFVIVIGGGSVGCETALHLAQKGKELTILEILDSLATRMITVNRMHLLKLLANANVRILTETEALEITDEGIIISDKDGKRSTLGADTIVLAIGLKPNKKLFEALNGKVSEIYAIGDCVEPRKVVNAIREGFRLARII